MKTAKLRLKSKKLQSGKYQVDFTTEGSKPSFYGHLLAEPFTPLHEVIENIHRHVASMADRPRYLQRNLFSVRNRELDKGRILIFQK